MSRRSSTGSSPPARAARVLHLDLFSGISGNMFLGALLDAGLARRDLDRDLAGLGVDYRLRVRRVRRGPIAARYVEVDVPQARARRRAPPRAGPGHAHRAAGHAHGERHDAHGHAEPGHAHGRSYREIRRLLERARLDPAVRRRALATFEALGRAEARVHGISLEKVHFHEVGAVDAIVDVAGAAIGLERLGIERVTASPVALG